MAGREFKYPKNRLKIRIEDESSDVNQPLGKVAVLWPGRETLAAETFPHRPVTMVIVLTDEELNRKLDVELENVGFNSCREGWRWSFSLPEPDDDTFEVMLELNEETRNFDVVIHGVSSKVKVEIGLITPYEDREAAGEVG